MLNYICTYGRSNRQITWDNLPLSVEARTFLVVQEREKDLYKDYPKFVLPDEIRTIGKTRQHLIDTSTEPFIMLDDDLVFATRRADVPSRFHSSTAIEVSMMFETIEMLLQEGWPLVGVSVREGANYNVSQFLYATRQMRVHGVIPQYFKDNNIRFDRMELMEDFDVVLQLLESGKQNIVCNGWVTNQHGSNTEGGCSTYRTLAKQAEAANLLHTLHPHYVKVVQKKTKSSWGGQERTDVQIAWKSAYREGVINRGR